MLMDFASARRMLVEGMEYESRVCGRLYMGWIAPK